MSSVQSADSIGQITAAAGQIMLDKEKTAKADAAAASINAEIEEMMRENGIMEFSILPDSRRPKTQSPSMEGCHLHREQRGRHTVHLT